MTAPAARQPIPEPPAVIDAAGITKRFGTLDVLRGIDLQARSGSVTAMIGASGSGKSTFLRCLNLLEVPTGGRLVVEGVDVNYGANGSRPDHRRIREVRQRIGMVFQNFNLWSHMTALENVSEGLVQVRGMTKAEARDRAAGCLSRVGLSDRMGYYPAQLSGGQQQRAAIARAIAMEPQAILFDEPTSALDPELVREVLRVIEELAAEHTTMIIVTHEMAFARNVADHIVFLHKGLIAEQGPPSTVFDKPTTPELQRFLAHVH